MGPQHDSCGRLKAEPGALLADDLQWGRNMIVAEGSAFTVLAGRASFLQWGRNMIVAEGARPCLALVPQCNPSMGPQHDSCGRVPNDGYYEVGWEPSMGPQHDSCGRLREV